MTSLLILVVHLLDLKREGPLDPLLLILVIHLLDLKREGPLDPLLLKLVVHLLDLGCSLIFMTVPLFPFSKQVLSFKNIAKF